MKIEVVGLNHKSAPIDIRERLTFDSTKTIRALRQLKSRFPEAEFVLLSTCNRIELYSASKRIEGVDTRTTAKFLSKFHNVALDDFQDFLYVHSDADAVEHLLSVASSLDSMVVGEVQIIGQVKESYRLACAAKSTGKILNSLFHRAFTTSKKIHATTSISNGRVSVAGVAVELAMQLFADISSAKVVVIGAGKTGELLLQHLLHVGCKNITVINRSYDRGQDVANRYGVEIKKWEELDREIIVSDIVIASAAVQDYLFNKNTFKTIIGNRRKGTLLIVDIAVPRNFEPSINEIEDVYLYSIDELSDVAEQNRKVREDDIAKGMQIVRRNVDNFMDWFRTRDIGPLIGQMKEKFGQISRKELERFFAGVRQEAAYRELTESMVNRIVNKLLHCVIKNINVVAKKYGQAEAAKLVDSIVRQVEEMTSEPDDKEKVPL